MVFYVGFFIKKYDDIIWIKISAGFYMSKADVTVLRINLLENFENLLNAVSSFSSAVRNDGNSPAWVSRTDSEIENSVDVRAKAAWLYHALWYEEGQDGRATVTCPGIIGATLATVNEAYACNAAKDDFKKAILALKTLKKSQADEFIAELHQRSAEVNSAMQRMGAARLNLKQAYRHIPILDVRPIKIGFTWSKQGKTIQRTTVSEARRLLEKRRDMPQVRNDLNRLQQIPNDEVLARVRTVCPHLRANVVFENAINTLDRRLIQAPLPIIVPLRPGERLPEFVPIPPVPLGNPRLQRSDVRIEDDVFLPTIRTFRYRQPFRCR